MTPLERRYRKLLRWLPAAYRQRWEDDMVAAFLESMHTDDPDDAEYIAHCGKPSRAEKASILRLAVRLRLGGTGAEPRELAWGDAVRLVALVGLLANAATSAIPLWQETWLSGRLPWPPVPPELRELMAPPSAGAWEPMLGLVAAVCWAAALVAVTSGHRRQAALMATVAFLPAALGAVEITAVAVQISQGPLVMTAWIQTLAMAVPIVALLAFHHQAPKVRARPWLVALGVTLLLAPLPAVLPALVPLTVPLDPPGLWSIGFIVAAIVHLARQRVAPSSTSLALAIIAMVILVTRLVILLEFIVFPFENSVGFAQWATAQALMVGGLGAVVSYRARRTLDRFPPTRPGLPAPIG